MDDHSLQVMQLSDTLRELAFVQKENPEVFRNPNGVAMKLANFAALDPAHTGRGLTSYGRLDKQIWEEFANADSRLESEAARLRAGWQHNELSNLVAEESAEDEYDPAGGVDLRERTTKAIVQRRGQPTFRKALVEAYSGRCAVTGCNAVDALEAAHILGYMGKQSNLVSNGLLLRADVHTLFDLGLIAVQAETMRCLLAPQLMATDYRSLLGNLLNEPVEQELKPSRYYLNMHRLASKCN